MDIPIFRLTGLLLCGLLGVMACARVRALEGPPQDLQLLMQEARNIPQPAPPLQATSLPVGPEVPYTPLMQPPRVQRVWVPDHLNAEGDLVSGHWVYLLLEPARWFLETYPPAPTPTLRTPLAPPVPPQVGALAPGIPGTGSTPGTSPLAQGGGPEGAAPAVSPTPHAAPPPLASGARRRSTP